MITFGRPAVPPGAPRVPSLRAPGVPPARSSLRGIIIATRPHPLPCTRPLKPPRPGSHPASPVAATPPPHWNPSPCGLPPPSA